MAWNTWQMQTVFDRWAVRNRSVPEELVGRIAPTRVEAINLRGVFSFPIERHASQLLPSVLQQKQARPAEHARANRRN